MKFQEIKKCPMAIIILNIMIIVMVIISMFSIYTSQIYISELVKQGFNPTEQIAEVIKYYINSITPYVFYTICLATLSCIVKKVLYLENLFKISKVDEVNLEKSLEVEDEIDMLLKELDV